MEKLNGFSPDRKILCLFDVDGTLTPPREVRVLGYCLTLIIISSLLQRESAGAVFNQIVIAVAASQPAHL